MNKIVCLLVALLVYVSVASGADSTQLNNELTEFSLKMALLGESIKEMSASSDVLTSADADAMTEAGINFVYGVNGILEGNGETQSAVASEITTSLTNTESKIEAHLTNAGAKAGSSSSEVKAAIAAMADLFDSFEDQAEKILSDAVEIAGY